MRKGFSLVELSIVLVILGLLTGGILAGQSLIRAAELRAVTNEFNRYTTALGTFRDKYFALPGDITNATAFWGTAAACPGISTTAVGGTCNGDGNGLITPSANSNEVYGAWRQLALAGLVEGSYTGNSGDTTAADVTSVYGTNAPRSRMSNGGWLLYGWSTVVIADVNLFDGNYGNAMQFGGTGGAPLLKPEEAWNIDTKLDDGNPATGRVVSNENQGGTGTTNCSNLAASTTVSLTASTYSLSNNGAYCTLNFKTGY
jgi:prepilin-type N-terminal cleavage/methylation domain-containing protein